VQETGLLLPIRIVIVQSAGSVETPALLWRCSIAMWNVNESAHRCSDGSDGKRSGAANRKSNVRLGREGMSLQLPGVFDFVGDGDIAAAARQQIETHQRRCRRNLHKGHVRRRWSISSLFYRLVALALLSLPIVTQQVEQFPTQIAIVSAPFLASGMLLANLMVLYTHLDRRGRCEVICWALHLCTRS
jgi:hypothetical protein